MLSVINKSNLEVAAVFICVVQVDLLRGQKTDKVDVTLQPEELEVIDDVLAAKYDCFLATSLYLSHPINLITQTLIDRYEEARQEEKERSKKEDFSDMVAEVCFSLSFYFFLEFTAVIDNVAQVA